MLSLAAAAACTAGGAGSPAAVAAPPASPSGPVTGTVLEPYGHPLPDQIVAIGDAKTTSDGEGRFSFASVPARYDLVKARHHVDVELI